MANLLRVQRSIWLVFVALLIAMLPVNSVSSGEVKKKSMDATTSPAAKWAAYGIIDIHAHIGSFKGYEISKSNMISNVQHYGIKTALISNLDCADMPGVTADLDEESANAETAKLVNEDPLHFRGLIWVRPPAAKVKSAKSFIDMRMGSARKKRVFVGMKFHPEFDHYCADDNTVDAFMELCADSGIPAVFHCGAPGSKSEPERIYKLAKRHPSVPVLLYHMGFNSDHVDAISTVAQAIKNKDANLFVETSQCSTDAVMAAIKKLGAKHVLFGTDATYYGKDHYHHYVDLVDKLKSELSPADFDLVMRENALRLFPL